MNFLTIIGNKLAKYINEWPFERSCRYLAKHKEHEEEPKIKFKAYMLSTIGLGDKYLIFSTTASARAAARADFRDLPELRNWYYSIIFIQMLIRHILSKL